MTISSTLPTLGSISASLIGNRCITNVTLFDELFTLRMIAITTNSANPESAKAQTTRPTTSQSTRLSLSW